MILNEDFDFDRDAPQDVKGAFLYPPSKDLLKSEDKLCRILTPVALTDVKNQADTWNAKPDLNEVGQWWTTQKAFNKLVAISQEQGKNLSAVTRGKLAISLDFSSRMNGLCIVELKRDMYGFQGLAAPQRLSKKYPNLKLPGNYEQVWIPKMSWNDVFLVKFVDSFRAIERKDLFPHLTATLGDFLKAQKKG